jgi:hypothetical protein
MAEFTLVPRRKKNMARQHSPSQEFILNQTRNRIETVFRAIISKMPRHIRARTRILSKDNIFYYRLFIQHFIVESLLSYLRICISTPCPALKSLASTRKYASTSLETTQKRDLRTITGLGISSYWKLIF